jgi:hypothetical protein
MRYGAAGSLVPAVTSVFASQHLPIFPGFLREASYSPHGLVATTF